MAREYTPKHIRPEVWKRITSVIRDYNRLKAELGALDEKAADYTGKRKQELVRKTAAFETAFNRADGETRELVIQKFWKRRLYRDISVHMSERNMQRYIKRFVIEVGRNLGEID